MAHLALLPDGIATAHAIAGTTTNGQLARAIGIDQSSLWRIVARQTQPGIKFVAGVAIHLGVEHVFSIVEPVA
jgi:hypothetical protein